MGPAPIYDNMMTLWSEDGPAYVWPITEPSSRARYRIAAAREYLSEHGVDVGPGDGTVSARELLRWVRSMTMTGVWRQHTEPGPDGEWEPDCGCEEPDWWCGMGDRGKQVAGWSFMDADHPEELPYQWEES